MMEEGVFDTKLHEAVRYGDLEEVKVALQQGYDPNLIGLYQWSALHEAAHNGHKEILRLLLEKKGDPNKSDYIQQRTAMHYASEQGHIECLKMLLDKGGKYNIKDANGKSSLDVATPGGRRILEKLRVRDLMKMSPEEARQSVEGDNSSGTKSQQTADTTSQQMSDTSSDTRRSSASSVSDKGPALGYIHLSFEYHSAKSSLKVRAWQLTDLLLPPPNTSMIHSIYVKSYLVPDKKKETKRKTEEVKVETTESHIHWKKSPKTSSIQHIFTPSTFKFSKPLEYANLTSETIKEKHIQIEVCITQKYSHRSFLIGMLNMPLKSAVKRIVKEKVALIPCVNHTIPTNMTVYGAQNLNLMSDSSSKVFFSNPNVRVMIPESLDGESDRAASDPDLQVNSPSVEVDMCFQSSQSPMNVPKLDFSGLGLDESGYSSEVHVSVPGEMESPDSDNAGKVRTNKGVKTNVSTIDMGERSKGHVKRVLDNVKGKLSPRSTTLSKLQKNVDSAEIMVEEVEEEEELNTVRVESARSENNPGVEDWKYGDIKNTARNRTPDSSDSRPSTPTWDYYDMPDEVVTFDSTPASPQWEEGPALVLLPMAVTMEIAAKQDAESKDLKKSSKTKGSKKKGKKALPGKAVPLVPEIVIINADDEAVNDTRVNIPDVDTEKGPLRWKKKSGEETKFDHTGSSDHKEVVKSVRPFDSVVVEGLKSGKKDKKDKGGLKTKSKNKSKETGSTQSSDDENDGRKGGDKTVKKSGIFSVARRKYSKGSMKKGSGAEEQKVKEDNSFVIEMDELSFNSADSHVVELDDGVTITEISEGQVTSTDHSLQVSELESVGRRLPVNISPHQYMIPINVYTEDDTSCDESLPTDRSYTSYKDRSTLPTTEL